MPFPYGPNTKSKVKSQRISLPLFSRICYYCFLISILGFTFGLLYNEEKEDANKITKIKKHTTYIKPITPVKSKLDRPQQILPPTNRVYKLPDGRPSIPLRKMTIKERREWLGQARIDNAIACGRTNELGEAIIHKSPFKNFTHEVLAQIFTWKIGREPPPMMPRIPLADRQNLALIMTDMVSDQEGDSEQLKEARKAVRSALEIMKEYVKGGGSPDEFLDYYVGELKHYSNMRKDAEKSFREMLRTETDPQALKAYFDAINDTLEQKGILPLNANKNIRAIMGQ